MGGGRGPSLQSRGRRSEARGSLQDETLARRSGAVEAHAQGLARSVSPEGPGSPCRVPGAPHHSLEALAEYGTMKDGDARDDLIQAQSARKSSATGPESLPPRDPSRRAYSAVYRLCSDAHYGGRCNLHHRRLSITRIPYFGDRRSVLFRWHLFVEYRAL